MGKRPRSRIEPSPVQDIFASDFDVHDWDDWLRLICWVDVIDPGEGDGGLPGRRVAAAIVMPRSAALRLMEVVRLSAGRTMGEGMHS